MLVDYGLLCSSVYRGNSQYDIVVCSIGGRGGLGK